MYVTKQTREQGEGHGRELSEREPIAIVGIGCRLPGGANDPKSFWKMLCQRVDAIMPAPAERGNANSFLGVDARSPGSTAVLWAGFIEGIDQFDPEFFGISVREAPCVDPQQRLLLEAAWEALEDGGQVLDPEIAARTGVFVGISGSDYSQLQIDVHDFSALDVHSVLGLSMSIAANRISYCLDLHGPSVAVDTACSSSLVAIHLACRSIWEGESGLALAGGVNALLTPAGFVPMAAASMLSPDGRCKTFDARANGFVRAEGVGVVALKPLAAALADGNPIYALIRGTAANQDGRTAGITVPNGAAQAALVREACRFAGVRPAEVHYVEAHGTGTSVGDPIEANALGQVLGAGRADGNECIIGSVKTNIGHLEAGAGVAGIIKTALVLEHHLVPPHLHLVEPNPLIDFERLKLKLPLEAEPLPSGRLLAGVNSFGFGGANAHAVLESWEGANGKHTECPASEDDSAQRTGPMRLLPLSAQSSESLVELARRYADFFRNRAATAASPEWLRDVCYSASFHRKHHHHRLIVVADSAESFADKLEAFASGESRPGLASGHITARRKIAFVFGGQGPQWWGMGRQLLAREPVFRETIEECDRLLERAGAKWSLVEELGEDEASSRIHDPAIAQPAIFALQVALAALWRSWGVEPQTVAGHSVGEVAAAHVGGALDLESAARVIFHRGRCMALAESGRMMAAAVSEEEATRLVAGVAGFASVAAVNSPSSVTLAGDAEPLAAIEEELSARGTFCRLLKVQYAFHSARMEPLREDLLGSIHGVEASPLRIPMWSTVTGAPAHGEPLGATYWWRNVREPVQFCAAARGLAESEHNVFVELSPHPVLLGYLRESMDGAATFATSLRRGEDECATMLTALGTLHAVGHRVGLRALYPDGGRCVRLPRYAWRHQRYWQELSSVTDARGSSNDHPLLGRAFRAARPYWEKKIGPELLAFLGDHRVQGHILFPAAGYLEMALAAGKRLFGTDVCTLEDVEFLNPLLLPESGEAPRLQLTYDAAEKEFAITSRASNAQKHWTLHCVGRLVPGAERSAAGFQDLGPAEERVRVPCSEELYARLDQMGLQYGLAFRRLQDLWRGDREAVGGVALPEEWDDTGYQVHPALLDGCFHAMLGADLSALDDGRSMLHLPARVRRVRLHSRPGPKVESRVRLVKRTPRALEVDVHVHDAAGSVALEIEGLTVLGSPSTRMSDRLERSIYAIEWQLKPRSPAERKITSADFLPALDEMAPLLERAMKRGHLGGSLRRMVEAEPDTDRLCVHYVVRAFEDLGVSLEVGARISVESVRARVAEAHQRVVERYLALLEAHGILVREGRDWRVREAPERVELEAFFRKVFAPFPNPGVMLLRSCGRELARLLRGEVDALLLLFGETSFLDLLYTESVEMRGPYRTARQMLRVAAERVPPHRRLRILEVGAGTGGLAATMLPILDPRRTEYVFTDRTSHFLKRAEERFAARSFVRYQTLDLDRDPREQGFGAHEFDLILASDVLHATESLRRTLAHIRMLLAPSGFLVALELEQPPRWLDLVFALTKGWWCFQDPDLRVDSPLLKRGRWVELLLDEGFVEATSIIEPDELREPIHSVLVARGPSAVDPEDGLPVVAAPGEAADAGETVVPEAAALPSPELAGGWLLFADDDGFAERLADRLRERGQPSVLAFLGEEYRRIGADRFQVRPESREDLRRLLDEPIVAEEVRGGAVFLWSLDAPGSAEPTTIELDRAQARGCQSALCLVQELEATPRSLSLWLVTRATQPAGTSGCASITHAPMWGLGRVVMNEHAGVRCHVIDLAGEGGEGEVSAFAAELLEPDGETEIALRGEARYVVRVARASSGARAEMSIGSERPFRVEIHRPGVVDELKFRPLERRPPGPGEVEIEVAAASLNFRDLMKAMGLYPRELEDSHMLGDECAGKVVAVGPDVTDYRVGDEVVAIGASNNLQSHTVMKTDGVLPRPEHLGVEEAVTIPIAFLTAAVTLERMARLRAGERVLIHSATGGVGFAAVEIAQRAGAEIFATAGTARKRALLEAMGVAHVMDSRSLAFADDVMRITGGEGVDVVLNSLAGDAVAKGMSLLRPNGRFIEIGKRDLYQNTKVGLRALRHGCSLQVFDLNTLVETDLAMLRRLWTEIHEDLGAGRLHPLPLRVFPVAQVAEGFRCMMEGAHVGKIVFSFDDPVPVEPLAGAGLSPCRPDATYLVTGGLGGFGLAVARWLVEKGARHLVLIGRSGASTDEARCVVEELRREAEVEVVAMDVANEPAVAALVARIARGTAPLRGVVHGAMVLDDGLVLQLDHDRMQKVLAPKVLGAWNLHRQTAGCALDFFVVFSSFTAIVGAPGQANYAAANTALDSLAHYRRSKGLKGLSVNWGEIKDVGYVARTAGMAEALGRRGLEGFGVRQALGVLEQALSGGPAQLGVMTVDWQRLAEFVSGVKTAPRFSSLISADASAADQGGATGVARERILSALPSERRGVVEAFVRDQVARVLRASPGGLDTELPLSESGLDSLMAVELIHRLEGELGVEIQKGKLTAGGSARKLVELLLEALPGSASNERT